jgi:hypothetical protein
MFRKILHRIGFSNFCKTLKLLRFKFSAAVAFVPDIYFKCPGSFEGLGNELPYLDLLCHFDTCSKLHCEVIHHALYMARHMYVDVCGLTRR